MIDGIREFTGEDDSQHQPNQQRRDAPEQPLADRGVAEAASNRLEYSEQGGIKTATPKRWQGYGADGEQRVSRFSVIYDPAVA